jgi:hypothetical protein
LPKKRENPTVAEYAWKSAGEIAAAGRGVRNARLRSENAY